MIPSALSEHLSAGMADFLRASFRSVTPGMGRVIDELIARPGALSRGPYLSAALPFTAGTNSAWFPHIPLPFTPHAHQEAAFERLSGRRPRNTLVATGTGSGKTECFLLPVLDHCRQTAEQKGVKAILVYPMNALATDQAKRIARMIDQTPSLKGRVKAGLYVGESSGGKRRQGHTEMGPRHVITDRAAMQSDPPDILLTNYKMLDYLLLRPEDQGLWKHNRGGVLQYLVVDELHTFDGAQGTDLACLVRRLKRHLEEDRGGLCCVGTSATLGGEAGADALVEYASDVFGELFDARAVITEQRVSVDDFIGDAPAQFTDGPEPAQLGALTPRADESPATWLQRQAGLWFDDDAPDLSTAAGRVTLGERLKGHALFRATLRALDGRPMAAEALVEALGRRRRDFRRDEAFGRAVVISLVGLVSAARVWRGADDAVGGSTGRFLDVRVQLWYRALSRMVATVEAAPRLVFSDDLDREQSRQHLPMVHCRECRALGWATVVDRDKPHRYSCGLQGFYRKFFGRDAQVRFLWPAASRPDDPAWRHQAVKRVSSRTLSVTDEGDDAVALVESPNLRTVDGKLRSHNDCPFCGAQRVLTLVGYQPATLLSVFVDQLFGLRFNPDKKLLAFSDNVQDAAHRAGFFEARTWRTNLRVAMAQALVEAGRVRLDALPDCVAEWGHGRLSPHEWLSTFLPPDMDWMAEWDAFRGGSEAHGESLARLVERRLRWETVREFGHRSRLGRALMRSGAAAAVIDPDLIEAAVDAAIEPLRNEVPGLRDVERKTVRWLVLGLADRLRQRGAIVHPELPNRYLGSGGGDTYVFKQWTHLPSGQQQLPIFLTDRPGTARFETWTSPKGRPPTWYGRWVARVLGRVGGLGPDADSVYRVLLPAMVQSGLLVERVGEDDRRIRVWGLPESAIWIEAGSRALGCSACGYRGRCGPADGIASDGLDGMMVDPWRDMPCVTATCPGHHVIDEAAGSTFHGAQYTHGDVARIFAEEHTGLLKRDKREQVEDEFKAQPDDEPPRRSWYPNLLSCTPTLEMGIDIGDLSSTILCQVPPAQANYLQRVGRAGRRDGNAFVLTMATSRPHDLYFFAEPTEMLAGEVSPPGIYLDAAAVLERQLAAYCVDRWVAEGGDEVVLPRRLRKVLSGLASDDPGRFPKSLLAFIEGHRPRLLREFCDMFDGRLGGATQAHLKGYLEGDEQTVGSFGWRLSDLLHAERKQRDSLSAQVKTLTAEIRKLKKSPAPPKDLDERVGELEDEKQALQSLVKELDGRRTLEFLTNEGILPNYAFPESPVRLRSVIWRKKVTTRKGEGGFERRAYEYTRPPATALTELAPEATFYAGGRKVTIDQVDLPVAEVEEWRFCPACNHATPAHLEEGQQDNCSACGTPWSDPDQKLRLLRMRQVFARAPERTSRIRDQHDEREPRFFQREMLVDHSEKDRGGAWRIDDPQMPFGVEFLTRATFRELNFGEPEAGGAQLTIAGRAEQRPGFVVCAQCGKVQPSERVRRRERARGREAEPQHTPWCPSKVKGTEPVYEKCLYLYRTFDSEALRILMPLAEVGSRQGLHSFVAALQTGLRARFGGRVDHIRTTLYSEPDETSGLRRQYLVLYDSVPGGTGYLKQLVTEGEDGTPALRTVLEYALDRIENCVCWHDPDRDGCYRCLYHHRNARDMNDTSARVAEGLIRRLLDVWHRIEPIESLGNVSLSGLMDSVLEARFIEALRHVKSDGLPGIVEAHLIGNAKPGFRVKLGGQTWSIEPQVSVGPDDGVEVPSKIDFVLRQSGAYGDTARSIAVFTDGWQFHRDRVGLDLQQRQALIAAGWEVWSFTWADVDAVLAPKVKHERRQFIHPDLSALAMRLKTRGVTEWAEAAEAAIFQVFADRLARAPDAPPDWARIGLEMAAARVARATSASTGAWHALVESAAPSPIGGVLPTTIRLSSDPGWPSGEHVRTQTVHDGQGVAVLLALDDEESWHEHPDARAEWNGLLHALNLLQGLAHGPTGLWAIARGKAQRDGWQRLLEARTPAEGWAASDLYEDEYRPLLEALEAAGVEAPDVGIELDDDRDQVWGEAELVWVDAKVAVVYADVKEDGRGMPPGWVIFVLETVQSDPAPLIERLGKGDE